MAKSKTAEPKPETEVTPKEEDIGEWSSGPAPATMPGSGPLDDLVARMADLEQQNARLVLRNGELSVLLDQAKALRLGESIVLDEDDAFETVVVHRKRAARPTGRYVPRHHYRFAVAADDRRTLEQLAEQGAAISDGAPGTRIIALVPNLRPLREDERPPAYDLPTEIARHGVAAGALEEEVA